MNIVKATAKYEAWLATHLKMVEKDLAFKHEQMRLAPFPFMRATYYRWAQLFPEICEETAKAPSTLAVGDLHVENFGTWRDIEGRLIWGVNDFDEAWPLPYTNDLVRLGASALMSSLACDPKAGLEALLQGYADALEAGGRPFALAEHHTVLRAMATARLHDPEAYWTKLRALPLATSEPPAGALKAIARMMPERGLSLRVATRTAGLGSLGRQRYVAITDWRGGGVAREAKALAPSACLWAKQGKGTAPIRYQEILRTAIRCRDPFVGLQKRWIVRRLAPDCSRITLADLPQQRDELRLLRAMGWETANIHLGTRKGAEITADLKRRPAGWLHKATKLMREDVLRDWKDWRKHGR